MAKAKGRKREKRKKTKERKSNRRKKVGKEVGNLE